MSSSCPNPVAIVVVGLVPEPEPALAGLVAAGTPSEPMPSSGLLAVASAVVDTELPSAAAHLQEDLCSEAFWKSGQCWLEVGGWSRLWLGTCPCSCRPVAGPSRCLDLGRQCHLSPSCYLPRPCRCMQPLWSELPCLV